jgi:hypothetical protein
MQQGLTSCFCGQFWQKIPLKINARISTVKVTYQELIDIKAPSLQRHAGVVKSGGIVRTSAPRAGTTAGRSVAADRDPVAAFVLGLVERLIGATR